MSEENIQVIKNTYTISVEISNKSPYALARTYLAITGTPIPREGDEIVIDGISYNVVVVFYDYDHNHITIRAKLK